MRNAMISVRVGLAAAVFVVILPVALIWLALFGAVGSVRQTPDGLQNRYYQIGVYPLLLPLLLLPG